MTTADSDENVTCAKCLALMDPLRAAEDAELIRVLEAAIVANNTDVIDRIIGVTHQAPQPIVVSAPDITINLPAKSGNKKFVYTEVGGKMRPTGVVEEE